MINAPNRPMCSVQSAPCGGAGAALVLPACNTEAMQLHLDEIATKVTPGAHAVVVLDQAGWHKSQALKVPRNISLLSLPPRSPELILIGPAVRHHDLPIDPWRHIHGPPALTSVTVIAWGMLSG